MNSSTRDLSPGKFSISLILAEIVKAWKELYKDDHISWMLPSGMNLFWVIGSSHFHSMTDSLTSLVMMVFRKSTMF